VTYQQVLVISADEGYLDDMAEALSDLGAFGVLTDDAVAAAQALDEGFQPEIVILDPLLADDQTGEEVVTLLREAPQLAMVPVVALSSPPPLGALASERLQSRRVDRDALLLALQKPDEDAPSSSAS
jgi:CheY-like chemotaxis protein